MGCPKRRKRSPESTPRATPVCSPNAQSSAQSSSPQSSSTQLAWIALSSVAAQNSVAPTSSADLSLAPNRALTNRQHMGLILVAKPWSQLHAGARQSSTLPWLDCLTATTEQDRQDQDEAQTDPHRQYSNLFVSNFLPARACRQQESASARDFCALRSWVDQRGGLRSDVGARVHVAPGEGRKTLPRSVERFCYAGD